MLASLISYHGHLHDVVASIGYILILCLYTMLTTLRKTRSRLFFSRCNLSIKENDNRSGIKVWGVAMRLIFIEGIKPLYLQLLPLPGVLNFKISGAALADLQASLGLHGEQVI